MRPFAKNPALSAYLNSVVNLHLFVTETEVPDSDEANEDPEFVFDNIELTQMGLDLAKRYDSVVGGLSATKRLAAEDRSCTISALAEFGKHGGLCELSSSTSADRELLRDIFFCLAGAKDESHRFRRESLLLILDLCRQLSAKELVLNETTFASAIYFGTVVDRGVSLDTIVPKPLVDVATRWRMFQFHHFMAVAVEALFSWLVSRLSAFGLAGASVDSLVDQLAERSVRESLSEILQVDLELPFCDMTPAALFMRAGLPEAGLDVGLSRSVDMAVRSGTPFAEDSLEALIRTNERLYSSTGLALPMILLATALARYVRWEATKYGTWLANAASDPYLDLVPPLVATGLSRRFGDWWRSSWRDLTSFVLSRYVIQQHQSMSYEKTWSGERCLLQVDGFKVVSAGGYEEIGIGNPRLGSAIQVLVDLGLIREDESRTLTREGTSFLRRELGQAGE